MAIRRACEEVAVGTVVVASTQELERPIVKQSGRHETLFHAQQAISLLAPISKEMSSELNINTIVAQGADTVRAGHPIKVGTDAIYRKLPSR